MTAARYLHLLGLAVWLGAAGAVLVLARGATSQPAERRADRLELSARLHGLLVAPAAMTTLATGVVMMLLATTRGMGARLGAPASAAMQGLGLLACVLELFVAFPTSQRLGRALLAAEAADLARAGERARGRLVALLPVTIALVVVALYLGVVGTPHPL